MAKKKQKHASDQDFKVDIRARHQVKTFRKFNASWDENYFSGRLTIPSNIQNNFNMMSAKVSRDVSNQNGNVQRVEIRRMDDYIQSVKDSQTDTDVTFFKFLLELLEPHPSVWDILFGVDSIC